ncbi:MAG: tetratricopeptide repeat protein [Blastocatellia bacterium]|nr:tetratricopeptide repeat protein [Blastocatellia bacterium]MCS7158035.1 tetratricopeptide repeat protein [Blastocatellia bacterium]MCX7752542.1 tetratricopeptide repeat protein [Blastocatellia bacterium]MDW8167343.1 tetratricopeptide repeat protein [Acidobacteriota bacterium]MDW8257332.1 tetratricopeptide repeat protein [Acidobacteriota bacterium]
MMRRSGLSPGLVLAAIALLLLSSPSQAGKKELEAIAKLQAEVLILQRQLRDLQESFDRSNGQWLALLGQIGENVAALQRTLSALQQTLGETQTRTTGLFAQMDSRLTVLETNLRMASERLVQLHDRIATLSENLAQAQRRATAIDPTDPIQLFSAAYGEYLKGNYELALDQFRQYMQRFPSLETTDNAQYWIGECLYSLGRYEDAVAEFDALLRTYPQSDKALAARLKKALALLELGRREEAIAELRAVARHPVPSSEVNAARQKLQQLGVPLEEPRPTTPRRRR